MIDTITIDVDKMPPGTVLTVGEITELKSDKIELQVDSDSIVLRLNDLKNNTTVEAKV